MSVADIRHRFDFIPDSAKRAAEVFGLQLDPSAPKHFVFHQRFANERVRDRDGFFVREKNSKGVHVWKSVRRGYIEVFLVIGAISINMFEYHEELPTLDAAKEWAVAFGEKYGFEALYVPTGAEATRLRPLAPVVPFAGGDSG